MTSALTTADFDSIRTLVSVTSDDLSDNDLNTAGIVPAINAIYANAIPDFSVLTANDLALAKGSAVHFAAAMTTPILRIRNGRRIKLGDFESQDNKVDWDALGDQLIERSKMLLMFTTVWQLAQKRRTLFVTSGPTSGGQNWPWMFSQWRAMVYPLVITWAVSNGINSNFV